MTNTEALRKALAVIETDRRALLYSHAYPAGSLTIPADDEAGADALAKYDEAIHAIRTALAQRPAADDRWAAGYKHGAWQARHCAAQPAATVVERADSATGVVECGSLNVSDNAQPAASGEPAEPDAYGTALLAAWGKVRDPGPAGDDVPHPTFCAGFRAAWDARAPQAPQAGGHGS